MKRIILKLEDVKIEKVDNYFKLTAFNLEDSGDKDVGIVTGIAAYPTFIEKYQAHLMEGALDGACGKTVSVYYAHGEHNHPPFGSAEFSCSTGSNDLNFRMELDLAFIEGTETPIYPLAHQSYRGFKTKKIKGVSLGLSVIKWSFNKKNEMLIEEAIPTELSVTDNPAIPGALVKQVLHSDKQVANNNEPCPCVVALVAALDETLRRL